MILQAGLMLILAYLAHAQGDISDLVIVVGTTAITADAHTNDCVNKGVITVDDTSIFGGWLKNCSKDSSDPTQAPGALPSTSGGKTVTSNEGESVEFVCTVTGMKINDTFAWTFTPKVGVARGLPLFQKQGENAQQTSPWYTFVDNNRTVWRMTINKVQRRDTGVYSCVVLSSRSQEIQSENFTLVVRYPVQINGVSPRDPPYVRPEEPNVIYFNETENATLLCLSVGNPIPDTFWRRAEGSRRRLQSGEIFSMSKTLNIYNISVDDEGIYTCEARQGEGISRDVYNVTVRVQHAPIVDEKQDLVRKRKGSSVELVCIIDSDPLPATALWYKGDNLLTVGTSTQHRSRLVITKLSHKDYHNYTCVVTNILGTSSCQFVITGRPVKPTIISSHLSPKMHVNTLEWTYEDYDTETEKTFRIYYQQKNHKKGGLKGMPFYEVGLKFNPQKPMHYNTTIHDLRANSTYSVVLFAVNAYGQGDEEEFEFRTAAVERKKGRDQKSQPTAAPQVGGNGHMTSSTMAAILMSICSALLLL